MIYVLVNRTIGSLYPKPVYARMTLIYEGSVTLYNYIHIKLFSIDGK